MNKLLYAILLVGLIGIIMAFALDDSFGDYENGSFNHTNINVHSSDRVLVVAPHPDDEAIGAAGVIRYSVEHNIPVKVVVVTDGDIGLGLASERHNESVKAMKQLGLNESDIIFLGYPDESLPSLLNKNWDPNNPYNKNGITSNVNYPYSYEKNASYCGSNVNKNLQEIIWSFKPTVILYPDSEDEQIDHWATNAFVEYATSKMNYQGAKYTYIVHDPPDWPSPRTYQPQDLLTPPEELTSIGYKWVSFPLSPYNERLKEASINTYTSQINSDSYIQSFIRTNEIFGIYPKYTTIVSNTTLESLSNNQYPPTVVKEPIKEDRGKGSIRSREITDVGFQMDKYSIWMSIKTKNNISTTATYEIHIIPLTGGNSKRIDIAIYNGTARYENSIENSFQSGSPNLQTRSNGFVVEIPSSALENVNSFMICAQINDQSPQIDWTAWRLIQITR